MNDKTFENYQKRMLDAMQNPNKQSDDLFTKLSNILENLKVFVNTGAYSQVAFMQEVERQFKSVDSCDEVTRHVKGLSLNPFFLNIIISNSLNNILLINLTHRIFHNNSYNNCNKHYRNQYSFNWQYIRHSHISFKSFKNCIR